MTAVRTFAQNPYGAFELKRCYQKNMLTGTLASISIPLLILAAFALRGVLTKGEMTMPGSQETDGPIIIIELPPPIFAKVLSEEQKIRMPVELPNFGAIPNPVEDDRELPIHVVASIHEKIDIDKYNPRGLADGLISGTYTPREIETALVPPPTTFVPFDENPVLVQAPLPAYPEMAQRAGIEADVILHVYVNVDGTVGEVRIARPSGFSAGFEEAAIAAAWKRVYRPALQNNTPVAVWISVKIKFRLTGN